MDSPSQITRLLRDAQGGSREILASLLEHPNIARLFDGGMSDDGLPFFALELVAGVPLDEFCSRENLSVNECLELFRKICAAVSFAHSRLVVHRDLKPTNILVTKDGAAKLLDFGIAKILSDEPKNIDAATVTKLGMMTPRHASSEQARGEIATTASDVYSLGLILYEILTTRAAAIYDRLIDADAANTEFRRMRFDTENYHADALAENDEPEKASETYRPAFEKLTNNAPASDENPCFIFAEGLMREKSESFERRRKNSLTPLPLIEKRSNCGANRKPREPNSTAADRNASKRRAANRRLINRFQ